MATITAKVQPKRIKVLENTKPVLYKEAVTRYISTPAEVIGDVGELLCNQHAEEKMKSRKVLLAILGNIRYLARLALPLRGNWNLETGSEGNAFFHLVQLRNGFSNCYNGTFGHSTVFVDYSLYQNSYIWHLTFFGLHSLGFAPLEGSLMVCWVLIS